MVVTFSLIQEMGLSEDPLLPVPAPAPLPLIAPQLPPLLLLPLPFTPIPAAFPTADDDAIPLVFAVLEGPGEAKD
jgi:hypothetical protein